MNEKDLVTFEQAKKLKELGFKEECDYNYEDNRDLLGMINLINIHQFYHLTGITLKDGIPAPTLAQVQNWLREEKKIHITIDTYYPNWQKNDHSVLKYECTIVNSIYTRALREDVGLFDSYHEALSAAIDYGLQKVVC